MDSEPIKTSDSSKQEEAEAVDDEEIRYASDILNFHCAGQFDLDNE